jgi:hypothetical protein
VAEHPVLGDQHRGEPFGVPEEQAVVPDAQPEHHVELRAVAVQELRLADGVAERLELPWPHLLVVGEIGILLRDAVGLQAAETTSKPWLSRIPLST